MSHCVVSILMNDLVEPDKLASLCRDYHHKIFLLEGEKWDAERICKLKMLEVTHLVHVC